MIKYNTNPFLTESGFYKDYISDPIQMLIPSMKT